MKNGIVDNLKAKCAAFPAAFRFVLCPLFFTLYPLHFATPVCAEVPKTGGIYEISDDLAAGSGGSVDLSGLGGGILLSGSIGQW